MNKSALKNFSMSARKKLLEQVRQKAFQIGITAKGIKELKEEAGHLIVNNIPQEKSFKEQRDKLIQEIRQKGYEQVMEEAAYTWFNRFIALRFMEVNEYLPAGVRVLSSHDPQRVEPDMIREALNLDLALDREVIYDLQDRNDAEGLFKYLLIHQCNDLNMILPFMFEKIADYTELLFPGNLLQEGSLIRDLVTSIPEEDWKEVEIIGWLYQYYISEKKDEVFADLKKNKKISKENIPAATQLFTPKWIVQYMVENSLGRLWLESHPNPDLQAQWKYYLEEAEQEPEVKKQLEAMKNPNLNPLEIKVLDPCCGSGHILVYAFEVLYEIYKTYGYMEEDIPRLILENNLFGLDIDDRAAQLASFAVMMKARKMTHDIFNVDIKLNIGAIQESNWMSDEVSEILVDHEAIELEQYRQRDVIKYLAETFKDAKEFGAILDVKEINLEFLEQRLAETENSVARDLLEIPYRNIILDKLPGIIQQAKIMGQKYDVVCTNPPYMGYRGMNQRLGEFLKNKFPNTCGDISTVFMEVCFRYCSRIGFMGMINIPSWMFLSIYEELRGYIIGEKLIINMLHFGRGIFGSDFGTTAFVVRNNQIFNYLGTYRRLFLVQGAVDSIEQKEKWFFEGINKYQNNQLNFKRIPGSPIAYWVNKNLMKVFNNQLFYDYTSCEGQDVTGDNDRFVRYVWEIEKEKIGNNSNWLLYAKGGGFRKWYGNLINLIDWSEQARSHYRKDPICRIIPEYLWYRRGITWGLISSSRPSFRILPEDATFDKTGSSVFFDNMDNYNYFLGLLNSCVSLKIINIYNPTISFQVKDIRSMPIIMSSEKNDLIEKLVLQNINISKADWDNFEISWDFRRHPFLSYREIPLSQVFIQWENVAETQFNQLKANEEKLNRIFIDIYGLQDELTPEVEDKDITIRQADREREIKSFISYAVGSMFGRYSLDEEGLIFAGGKFDPDRYKTFKADADGILPVLGDAYFDDDIVAKFVEFVRVTFGEITLAENLDYIADTLGRKANETARECLRRYFLKDFYKDHVQIYKKRPIYWLFTSGKEQGFNALIYMHRYDSSTVSRVRTDYLHPLQNKLEAEYQRLNNVLMSDDSPAEKNRAAKRLKELTKQMEELKKYDEIIHNLADQQIEIDLDDGVAVNYAKFEKVLAKI